MNKKYEKYLPLGTVLMLKGGKKKLMITGFCAVSKEKEGIIYDYIGCLYPEGIITTDKNIVFNHSQIERLYAIGYSDDEEKKFKENLNNVLNNKKINPIKDVE